MEYNTNLEKLILPEYGRNVQRLVQQAVKIEDDNERNAFVQKIIDLMGRMYPYLRDLRDFKHKLWDHLVIMSDFKLNSPYPKPTAVTYARPPFKIPYSDGKIRYRHYGKSITNFIRYATEMEDGENKNLLIGLIANHMKKLYLSWNKESVTDDIIFSNLIELSGGKIKIPQNLTLSESAVFNSKNKKKRSNKKR